MIDCISTSTSHHFPENLLVAQHQLCYREVIEKENWGNIYIMNGMEFDRYDNLATEYYIARDPHKNVVGVCRSYPTTIPYMLSEAFQFLFKTTIPANASILEASRLVLDRTLLTKEQRQPVIDQLMLAYMERGLQRGIDAYVGFMLPKIWESTYQRVGWDVEWLGDEIQLPGTTDVVRAGMMPVNKKIHLQMCAVTGIKDSVLHFGTAGTAQDLGTVEYSHKRQDLRIAA